MYRVLCITVLLASTTGCLSADSSNSGEVACEDRQLACDAVYTISTTLDVETEDGSSYCGPLTVTTLSGASSAQNNGEETYQCDCVDGMLQRTSDGPDTIAEGCQINPPWGRTSPVTVEAPGYRTVETSVTLPCMCHPTETLEITLEPSE